MPLSLTSPEADALAKALAERTGETMEEAVLQALRERLTSTPPRKVGQAAGRLLAIGRECAALPDYDTRTAEEILGYDEHGLPH